MHSFSTVSVMKAIQKNESVVFSGEYYTEYDNENDRTKTRDRFNRLYPRRIADDFPGVPYPIDTVFFNIREELLYFFKNDKVNSFMQHSSTLA